MQMNFKTSGGVVVIALGLLLGNVMTQAALPNTLSGKPLPSLAPILKRVLPGVVNISTQSKVTGRHTLLDDPFFRRFFDVPEQRKRKENSLGSGVIINARKGYIVTNHHVIKGADSIKVVLHDGRSYQAKVVGVDPESDIALIQIPAKKLTAVALGRSRILQVGDFVVAIGNPFGLKQTVTSGIVSALGRSGLGIEGFEDFIQTDASINPGNSGGALIDLHGELIGINTAILAPGGGNVGIGFAIPIDMVKAIVGQLADYGEVRRGVLGVDAQDITEELAAALKIRASKGAVITSITAGSSAAKAGLRVGDVVIAVEDQKIADSTQLRNKVGLLRIGETTYFKVLRKGKTRKLKIVMLAPVQVKAWGEEVSAYLAGSRLVEVDAAGVGGRNKPQSVVEVSKVQRNSDAARLGIKSGDQIISANRYRVDSIKTLKAAISKSQGSLRLGLRRGQRSFVILIR